MAMPETGLLEEPIRPTIREDTVAKKKPNTMTISAVKKFRGMGWEQPQHQGDDQHAR